MARFCFSKRQKGPRPGCSSGSPCRPCSALAIRKCPRGMCAKRPLCAVWCFRSWRPVVSPAEDQWICRTTTGCVALLGLIAGMVSYLHMHLLVELHGQPEWVAALTPLSVDGDDRGGLDHAAARLTGRPARRD